MSISRIPEYDDILKKMFDVDLNIKGAKWYKKRLSRFLRDKDEQYYLHLHKTDPLRYSILKAKGMYYE